MNWRRPGSRVLAASLSIACCLSGASAFASGFLVADYGGLEHGNVMTSDLTSIYFNPAGLTLDQGTRIYVEGIFGYRKLRYTRPEAAISNIVPTGAAQDGTPADAVGANSGRASALNFAFLPFLGAASDFGVKNLGVGLALYIPFGGVEKWDTNPGFAGSTQFPGAVDGVQRWAAIDGQIQSIYLTAAGAWRFEKIHLSVGLSVNLVLNSVKLTRARNADGTDNLVTANGLVEEGRSYIDVCGPTASLGFGLMWQPLDNLWIGASYQSQPGFGENSLSGTLDNKLGETASFRQNVVLQQSLPDIVRLGVRWRPIERLELRLNGDFQRWDVFNHQCILDKDNPNRSCKTTPDGAVDAAAGGAGIILVIPREWNDAFRAHLGASYFLLDDNALELFAGAAYDSNAVPDSTLEPSLIDQNKLLFDGGARYTFWKNRITMTLTYTQVVYLERTAPARPRTAAGTQIAPVPPSLNPDGAGTYDQWVGFFNLTGQYHF